MSAHAYTELNSALLITEFKIQMKFSNVLYKKKHFKLHNWQSNNYLNQNNRYVIESDKIFFKQKVNWGN